MCTNSGSHGATGERIRDFPQRSDGGESDTPVPAPFCMEQPPLAAPVRLAEAFLFNDPVLRSRGDLDRLRGTSRGQLLHVAP